MMMSIRHKAQMIRFQQRCILLRIWKLRINWFQLLKNYEIHLKRKQEEFWDIVKIGRTHLQDATPLTLGQEISGWKAMLDKDLKMIEESSQTIKELALGGTAVGTGINTKPEFPAKCGRANCS